jgi:hypothetical protein
MADAVRAELIGAAVTMAVDHVTEEVVGAFDHAGVPSMLLKGPSIARWLYPAGGRSYRDTDLLVRPEDFARAAAVLRGLGFGAPSHALVDHAHTYARDAGGYAQSVDLHRTLPYVAAPPADAWRALYAGHGALALGAIEVDVLGLPQRCLHIAIHALQHAFEARGPFEDLRRAIDAASIEEWAEAASVSRRLGAEDAMAAGLCLVPQGEALSDRLGLTAQRRGIVRIAATASASADRELPAYQVQRFLDADTFGERVRLFVNPVVLSPANLRQVSPLARRGRLGLGLAYAARPFVVAGRTGSALVSRRRILKSR